MISLIFLLFITTTSAATAASVRNGIPVESPFGQRLLNQNGDDAIDFTWVSGYSLKFHSCHTALEFRADGGGSGDEEESPAERRQLVQFRLCPTGSCHRGCRRGAGNYVVEMREFLEAYMEMEQEQLEYACEKVENTCYCYDDAVDEETCLQNCFAEAGLEGCQDEEGGNNNNNNGNFELDRYLECEALNEDDDYRESLYVGAYCSGNGIYLGTFTDRQCTVKASKSAYKSYTGYELPYSTTSIISKDCMSCKEPSEYDDDVAADQYDADEVNEICEELYERSAKCERNINGVDYKSTGGCEYINKLLPRMDRLANNRVAPSKVFAWLFFLSTVGLSAFIAMKWKEMERSKVSLTSQGGVAA